MSDDIKITEVANAEVVAATPAPTELPPGEGLWDAYETDTSAEDQGRWIAMFGSELRVRSSDHPAVNKVIREQQKRQMRIAQANRGELPDSIIQQNMSEEAAAVVVDWKNVTVERGKPPVPYSHDAAVALFSNPALRRLRNEVLGVSRQHEFFRKAAIKAVEGN